jgi:hypothetical protein
MLEALVKEEKERFCSMMEAAIETFDEKDMAKFMDAVNDLDWSTRELANKLTELGFPVSDQKIWKHRAKNCRCAR